MTIPTQQDNRGEFETGLKFFVQIKNRVLNFPIKNDDLMYVLLCRVKTLVLYVNDIGQHHVITLEETHAKERGKR